MDLINISFFDRVNLYGIVVGASGRDNLYVVDLPAKNKKRFPYSIDLSTFSGLL